MPDIAQAVRQATATWERNRRMYPGWLVLPAANRPAVSENTDSWTRTMLRSLEKLQPAERLHAIRELVWRKKILLEPFTPELVTAIENTLALFDCQSQTVEGEKSPDADWETIQENWRNTAIELLVEYRWTHDEEAFRQLIENLRQFVDKDPEIQQAILYEQCLWALYDLDFAELDRWLPDLSTENCDPVWAMRKSAMLNEIGRDDEAEQVRRRAIETIRALPTAESSVAGPSREGWAILPTASFQSYQTIAGRMDELAALKCDAMQERDAITKRIENSGRQEDPPSFDVGTRSGRYRFQSNYGQMVAAYQAIRLSEVAGLPPCATVLHEFNEGRLPIYHPADVAAHFLKRAADTLAEANLELATRLVVRACTSATDEVLERVLSRSKVATMTPQQAENLAQSCLRAIDHAMANLGHQVHEWRLNVAVETLSRLSVRVSSEQAETILDLALRLCANQRLAEGTGWTTVRHLLRRSWESLPPEHRSRRAIDLMEAPIAGLDGPTPLAADNWPDPAEVLTGKKGVLERTPHNEQQWQAAIDVVARGLIDGTGARNRASIRMAHLIESRQLTGPETDRISHALWDEQYTTPDQLPSASNFYDWGFLVFPEPNPGTAQERFRNKWLSGGLEINDYHSFEISQNPGDGFSRNPKDVESQLWQVGHAIRSLRDKGQQLALSETERQHLRKLVEVWADAPAPERSHPETMMFGDHYGNQTKAVVEILPAVIQEIGRPEPSLGEKIYQKLIRLHDLRVPALELAPTVARITRARLEDAANLLRVGMTSDYREVATNAASGILRWLSEASDPETGTPMPPDNLVREIGVAVAYRRAASLAGALQAARWIVENGTQANKEAIILLVADGLDYLATELSYDRDHGNPDDIPLLRLRCTELAVALAKDGSNQHHAVARWLEIAKDDPLPEVRNAASERDLPTPNETGSSCT